MSNYIVYIDGTERSTYAEDECFAAVSLCKDVVAIDSTPLDHIDGGYSVGVKHEDGGIENVIVVKTNRLRGRRDIKVLYEEDIPDMTSHGDKHTFGFSIYKGIFVRWDEDQDSRVLDLIDVMPEDVLNKLVAIHEHEGCVLLAWDGEIPEYGEGGGIMAPDGDYWSSEDYIIH